MVAVMTELMVGGERSTQDDSIKGSARTLVSKLRLRALLQATARTHLSLTTSSPLLTNTFAQTCRSPLRFFLAVARRTIHSRELRRQFRVVGRIIAAACRLSNKKLTRLFSDHLWTFSK